MKDYYYNLDDAEFFSASGEKLPRCVPELCYQEHADWRIFLRTRDNLPRDFTGIVAWSAAVDCDFKAGSAPMCRTLAEGISADAATGAVTVRLDAATAEFLEVVDGSEHKDAHFELCGINSTGDRVICLCFKIAARMTLDPDPEVDVHTPDTLATKTYTALAISGALVSGSYVTSSGARTIAGSAVSGAIFSGAEVDTQIGDYRITATSGGGLAISGSGASVVFSGGQIAAKIDRTGEAGSNAQITVNSGGIMLHAGDDGNDASVELSTEGDVYISATGAGKRVYVGADLEDSFRFNGRPVATLLATSTDTESTSATFDVLSGGTSYIYTQPLYSLIVDSVVKTTEASYIHFALDSVTAPTPVVISGVSYLNEARFEGGKEYLLRFFDGMMETREVMSELEKPVDGSTGAWYKSGAAVLSSAMTLSGVAVSGGETLKLYDRGIASGATVYSGGTMYISSGGVGSNVLAAEAGGRTSVYAGGVLSGVTLSGGPVTVGAGGYVDGAYIHSGNLGVFGTAVGAVLYSGENIRVQPGGFASDATIIGRVCYISSRASATGFTISGGVCAPISGASMTDVTIRGGVQYVSGVVSGIILSGGTLRMFSGGTALAVTSLGGTVVSAEGSYIEYVTE